MATTTTTFAQRFTQACDDSAIIPEYGKGRQVAIAKRLGVTQEAVRKWFSGEAVPKPEKMRELAEYLEVDEAWLALGIKAEMTREDRRKANRVASGAVYIVSGLIMLEGGNIAWPHERDSRAPYVDIYAIMRGIQVALHVSVARELSKGRYEMIVPRQYTDTKCIGFVQAGPGKFHLIELPTSMIEEHKQRRAGDFSIYASMVGTQYHSGSDEWPRFKTFGDIL